MQRMKGIYFFLKSIKPQWLIYVYFAKRIEEFEEIQIDLKKRGHSQFLLGSIDDAL